MNLLENSVDITNLIINIPTIVSLITLIILGKQLYFKPKNNRKSNILMIILVISYIIMIIINFLYLKFTNHILNTFFSTLESSVKEFIFILIGLILNFSLVFMILIIIHWVLNLFKIKDKKSEFYLVMPFFAACILWLTYLEFCIEKLDYDLLYNGIVHTILSILLLLVSLVIPMVYINFYIMRYKISIYTIHSKFPINLDGITSEFISYEDYYHINYYDKDLKEISRQVILPKSEVVKVVRINDSKISIN